MIELANGDLQLENGVIIPCNKRQRTEVYSRVVGYLRPESQWNKGKQAELKDRVDFKVDPRQVASRVESGPASS